MKAGKYSFIIIGTLSFHHSLCSEASNPKIFEIEYSNTINISDQLYTTTGDNDSSYQISKSPKDRKNIKHIIEISSDIYGCNENNPDMIKHIESEIETPKKVENKVIAEVSDNKPCVGEHNSDTDIFNDDCNKVVEQALVSEPTDITYYDTKIEPSVTTVIGEPTEVSDNNPCIVEHNSDTDIFNGGCNKVVEQAIVSEPTDITYYDTKIEPSVTTDIGVSKELSDRKPCVGKHSSDTFIINEKCNKLKSKINEIGHKIKNCEIIVTENISNTDKTVSYFNISSSGKNDVDSKISGETKINSSSNDYNSSNDQTYDKDKLIKHKKVDNNHNFEIMSLGNSFSIKYTQIPKYSLAYFILKARLH
ncbi:hypothetical protein AYI70_g324 [Smittium culicis]|uniref:Uncharacterized protein n=1 Tax=Smittium culicis TaxID=133412 RepID=A0A1R1YH61_9FUNG|nr:hypothetical protein AYI70_g324 [Smittium culicis]